jgi:hypothetical protein
MRLPFGTKLGVIKQLICLLAEQGWVSCHHFKPDVVDEPFPYFNGMLWQRACKIEDRQERQRILRQIYPSGGYKSATDYSTAWFVEDLVEMHPNANVSYTPT